MNLIEITRKNVDLIANNELFRDLTAVFKALFEAETFGFELFYRMVLKMGAIPTKISILEARIVFYVISREIVRENKIDAKAFSLAVCAAVVDEMRINDSLFDFFYSAFKKKQIRDEYRLSAK